MTFDNKIFVKTTIILTSPTIKIFGPYYNFILMPWMGIKIPCFKSYTFCLQFFFRNNIFTIFKENPTSARG